MRQNTLLETPVTTHDPRNAPAYTVAEAARYLRLSSATVRSWFVGRAYPTTRGLGQFAPPLKPARRKPPTLSFSNLIEAHVLRSLRTDHGVPLQAVRQALAFAEHELGIDQLLLREELRAAAGQLFLDRYGELVNLSASGQLAMRKLFEAHLRRVEWGPLQYPVRLYPFLLSEEPTDARPILIDPKIAFGRPVIHDGFISTTTIVERLDAGEAVEDLAADYKISREAIEHAVLYERAA